MGGGYGSIWRGLPPEQGQTVRGQRGLLGEQGEAVRGDRLHLRRRRPWEGAGSGGGALRQSSKQCAVGSGVTW